MQLILITGLSGAGKSTALKILEDTGYYCVDNLPIPLLAPLVGIYKDYPYKKIAVSVDTRSSPILDTLAEEVKILAIEQGVKPKILYLDTVDDELIRRFSETRRKHPLSDGNKTIIDCINEERNILTHIRDNAHIIDTTHLSPNALRAFVKQFVDADYSQLNIIIQSFGFKYGLPIDSDFLFDVRCLPNPYYSREIRDFNGTEAPVIKFLAAEPAVAMMINDIYNLIVKWLQSFSLDNRNYLTISIGCTGGKHRSVYMVQQLSLKFKALDYKVISRHRQLPL